MCLFEGALNESVTIKEYSVQAVGRCSLRLIPPLTLGVWKRERESMRRHKEASVSAQTQEGPDLVRERGQSSPTCAIDSHPHRGPNGGRGWEPKNEFE